MKNVINGCIAIKMSGLIGALNNDSSRETEPCKINFDQVFFFLVFTTYGVATFVELEVEEGVSLWAVKVLFFGSISRHCYVGDKVRFDDDYLSSSVLAAN